MKQARVNAKLERRRQAFDTSPGIKKALTLAPDSHKRPGSLNRRKGA